MTAHSPDLRMKFDLCIKPDAYAAGATVIEDIDTLGFTHAVIIFACGTGAAGSTVDVKARSCATAGGTFADITGAVFSQKTEAGGTDEAIYHGVIRLQPEYRYLGVTSTVGTAACDLGVSVLLVNAKDSATYPGTPEFSV